MLPPASFTYMRRERFVNNAKTTLSGGVTSSATTITVADGAVFPSEGDYRLIVDTEVVLITARLVNDLTAVRGIDATTAASHSNGAEIAAVVTEGGLDKYIDDILAHASSRNPVLLGGLTSSSFTGVNMGTAVVSDDAHGGIVMKDPQTNTDFRLQVLSAPSTPYIITAKFIVGPGQTWSTSGSIFGLVFRESSTGKFILNYYEPREDCHVGKYDSPSVFNSFLTGEKPVDSDSTWVWQQIEDNGTNLFWRVSSDGVNFWEMGSESRTAFLASAPNQVGWAFNSRGLTNKLLHLKAWRQT